MKPSLLTALLLLALGSSALAQDQVDPEVLFHQSYIQEVVEGQVSVAALGYLTLMNDDSVPQPLRAESRFRFAICCVLLGRPDEARNHLALLLESDGTPESVKKRAEEYMSSLEGLGAGTELSKKLEALAFELGREKWDSPNPPTYRDFQIIGEPAVPFLKELLGHPDDLLRWHAYRILLLMDVPGLADIWDPTRYQRNIGRSDLCYYLDRNPEEKAKFEERMLSLDGEALQRYSTTLRFGKEWSLKLAAAVAEKEGCAELAAEMGVCAPWIPERVALVERWVDGENADLAWAAAARLSNFATGPYGDKFNRPEVFRSVVRALATRDVKWFQNQRPGGDGTPWRDRFRSYAWSMDHEVLLDVLTGLVEQGESWEGKPEGNPLVTGLADSVAHGLTREGHTVDQLRAYRDLLVRTMTVRLRKEYETLSGHPKVNFPTTAFRDQFVFLLENLPPEDAADLVAACMQQEFPFGITWLLRNWRIQRPGDVEILVVALKEADPRDRMQLSKNLKLVPNSPPEPIDETAAMIIGATADLANVLDDYQFLVYLDHFPRWALRVEPEVAIQAVLTLGRRVEKLEERLIRGGVSKLLTPNRGNRDESDLIYRRTIATPALIAWYQASDHAVVRQQLLSGAIGFLAYNRSQFPLKEALPALCKFIHEHIDVLGQAPFSTLAEYREYIPLESWIPLGEHFFRGAPQPRVTIPVAEADAAAYRLAEDPKQVNAAVLGFLRFKCSPLTRRSILEKLVAEFRGPDLARILADLNFRRGGDPVTPEILEQKLMDLQQAEDADIGNLAVLAEMVARTRPSEKLFPVVKRLLQSNDKQGILAGSRVAKSVGRTEMLEPLAAVLISMDPEIRNAAKSAMDSIRELQKLRDEQKLREAGLIPR